MALKIINRMLFGLLAILAVSATLGIGFLVVWDLLFFPPPNYSSSFPMYTSAAFSGIYAAFLMISVLVLYVVTSFFCKLKYKDNPGAHSMETTYAIAKKLCIVLLVVSAVFLIAGAVLPSLADGDLWFIMYNLETLLYGFVPLMILFTAGIVWGCLKQKK